MFSCILHSGYYFNFKKILKYAILRRDIDQEVVIRIILWKNFKYEFNFFWAGTAYASLRKKLKLMYIEILIMPNLMEIINVKLRFSGLFNWQTTHAYVMGKEKKWNGLKQTKIWIVKTTTI